MEDNFLVPVALEGSLKLHRAATAPSERELESGHNPPAGRRWAPQLTLGTEDEQGRTHHSFLTPFAFFRGFLGGGSTRAWQSEPEELLSEDTDQYLG